MIPVRDIPDSDLMDALMAAENKDRHDAITNEMGRRLKAQMGLPDEASPLDVAMTQAAESGTLVEIQKRT